MHTDSRKKDVLILRKGPTDGLGDTTITAETKSVIITKFRKKNCYTTMQPTVVCMLVV